MLKWLRSKAGHGPETKPIPLQQVDGWFNPQNADELLSTPERKRVLQQLWDNSPFSQEVWDVYWLQMVKSLAVTVQQLPLDNEEKYCRTGGFLDMALDVSVCAVRLSRGYMLPPGAQPEEQAAQSSAWASAIFWAALLHNMERLSGLKVVVQNGTWIPGLSVPDAPWRVRFEANPCDAYARSAAVALRLIPSSGITWLARWPHILDLLLVYLSGRKTEAGILNAIVLNARGKCGINTNDITLPVAAELAISTVTIEQNPPVIHVEQSTVTPTSPPIDSHDNNYNDNQLEKAQPVASALVSAIDQDDLSDSSLGTDESQIHSPATVDLLSVLDQQLTATVPVTSTTDVSITSSNETNEVEEKPVPQEELFWEWLVNAVRDGSLTINNSDSLVHIMSQYVFLQTPDCFYRFVSICNDSSIDKDTLQKNFESLNRHYSRSGKGIYIYRKYENENKEGRYTKMSGYMIASELIFDKGACPPDSSWLSPNK
ncbi:helicase/relaxase domain-containing protein [Brenneria izbisi]|uniref:Helicase/relaxase domain-containing protein n=1 Tax=Brenneria izbisi TaxID=2939450 RepID=A0AA41Y216_9GAMM|nr:helicase/relaxase domain-containing protein [Brenneria izbisi]MCV9879222.1 helicase/relaxase domain-containing protein [Brenneria izbisi]MCV9882744.1 helicase/relaxase domain-containing protein [Brenneria izbisi]